MFEYGAINTFPDSYSASSMGRLSSWFDDIDQAFSNLALIGASNAQLDGVFGGSNFATGKTVPQLLETWDKCLAWTASSVACKARVVSLGKVTCNRAGHLSQHVMQHHANLASPPFNRAVQFSRFLLKDQLTDTHRVLLLLLGLGPIQASTLLTPEVWQL